MADPSYKSEEIEAALEKTFGIDRRAAIKADRCVAEPVGCGGPAADFRDELSKKEYTISGFCQKCQDSFFGS